MIALHCMTLIVFTVNYRENNLVRCVMLEVMKINKIVTLQIPDSSLSSMVTTSQFIAIFLPMIKGGSYHTESNILRVNFSAMSYMQSCQV